MSFWISWPYLLMALAFGYALGSIPFGLLLTRLGGTADIRTIGSGNIGATNVLRTGRKDLAAATLALDALKATAAVLIAGTQGPYLALAAGFGAFLGHVFPVWLGFRGGKGVATYLGVLLGIALLPLVHGWAGLAAFAATWLLVAALSRFSSAAALAAVAAAPLALWLTGFAVEALVVGLMSLLVVAKHGANIRRLLSGTETRIGSKA